MRITVQEHSSWRQEIAKSPQIKREDKEDKINSTISKPKWSKWNVNGEYHCRLPEVE